MSPSHPRPRATPPPQNTGGPDDFGYTWDDTVPLDWIDASGGTDTGLGSGTPHVGPIDTIFPFKYYENTYSHLWISLYGFVAFNENSLDDPQGEVPSPSLPNDVIAPHWVPANSPDGYIRYLSGGNAPDRWFAVEWNHLRGWNDEDYTFEVVLHENGDILFQYKTMLHGDSWSCQSSGVEDSTGFDGLPVTAYCEAVAPDHAVRVYRPAPSARVRIFPLYQGGFSRAGATESFQVPIRNTGEFGSDVYDLTLASPWTASLFAADGTTPLTDTDGDGVVDTGPVAQASTVTVVLKVETPAPANVGDRNAAALTATSSLDPGRSKTATLQTAIPAPFAQVYRDGADGAMSLYLAQPAGQALGKPAPDGTYGSYPAVAETQDGFAYLWALRRSVGNIYVREIEYTLTDRYGETVLPVAKLTDHSGATVYTYDYLPGAAVAQDGRIGVTWFRYLYDPNQGYNYNVWMSILDPAGNVVYGPANLTNNDEWGYWGDYDWPTFSMPTIAATADNHFLVAWTKEYEATPGGGCSESCYVDDVFYSVRDTSGAEVKPITPFTADTPGLEDGYGYPNLSQLAGSRALLSYARDGDQDIYYGVLDSAGNVIKGATNLVGDGVDQRDWGPDAAQLADGRILVGWTGGAYPGYRIRFAVLDAAYNRVAGPTDLANPAATGGDAYVSVAADAAGHGILTWMDAGSYQPNLYYAQVDSSGNQVNPPMVFRTTQAPASYLYTSYYGNGNISYSWTPPQGVDGVVGFGSPSYEGAPGGNASLELHYANHGATLATGAVLVATLDSHLTYVSDTSGVVPVISGQDVSWNLPDLALLERHDFTLTLQVAPAAPPGASYPVELNLSSDGPEVNPADNTASAQVEVRARLYLPLVMRNFDPTLIFFDDFSDPNSGWLVVPTGETQYTYEDGEYQIYQMNTQYVAGAGAPLGPIAGNYSVEADQRRLDGTTSWSGLVFDAVDEGAYFFLVNPEMQQYALWKIEGGWVWMAGDYSPYINAGDAANHLKVLRRGGLIDLLVNDHALLTYYDDSFSNVRVEVHLWAYQDVPAIIRWDNFEVRNLGGAKVGRDLLPVHDSVPWPPVPIPGPDHQ